MAKSRRERISEAWKRFSETGSIGAYLLYRAMKQRRGEPPEE